jgi:MFS transporter, DHA2 family, multidrug resistance protein
VSEAYEQKAGRREWIGLAVLALPCMLVTMDLDVLYLAVPSLSADLAPSSSQLLWITDIYGFLIAGSLITMGTLGDRIGRRRLLLIGATAFGIASVIAAFSTTAEMLIAARALLGVAGATLAPSTLSLIRNMFLDSRQRTIAIGMWAASFSAGSAIGPLLGGVLLEYFWWGSVFLLAIPVMLLLLALGPFLLPEFRDPGSGRLDVLSAAMSLSSVLAVIYGLKRIAEDGLSGLPVLSILAGFAIGAMFVRRQRALADPLIDLRLFRLSAFSVSLATNIVAIFAVLGVFLFVAQYLQLVVGLSPLRAGLWTLPSACGLIAGSLLAPVIVRRVKPAYVMAAGLLVTAAGFIVLTPIDGGSGLPLLVCGSVLFSLGVAPAVTLSTDLIVGVSPPARAGAAAGMSETGIEFGGALGIAILGSIGSAVYRSGVADVIPSGMSPELGEAARDTLGGALAGAAQLPDRLGLSLLEDARDAFTQGLQVVSAVSAVIVIAVAVLVVTLLRDVRAGSELDSHQLIA